MKIPVYVHHAYESTLDKHYLNDGETLEEAIADDIQARTDILTRNGIEVEGFNCLCMLEKLPVLPKIVICHPLYDLITNTPRQIQCFKRVKQITEENQQTQFYLLCFHQFGASNWHNLHTIFDIGYFPGVKERVTIIDVENVEEKFREIRETIK